MNINPGDIVTLEDGPFAGLQGTVNETSGDKVILLLELIGKVNRVRVPREWVRLTKTERRGQQEQIRIVLEPVNRQLIFRLRSEPELLHQLSARAFEELIAHLMKMAGYDVQLTPRSGDGGRDILAVLPLPMGKTLTVVECKRYAEHRHIGPDIVRHLLWVADRHDNASHAMLATTSSFTRGARNLEKKYQWRLTLKDGANIQRWLEGYGEWTKTPRGALWQPGFEDGSDDER